MKAAIPCEFDGVMLGKSREAGEFQSGDEQVTYGDAFLVAMESSEGLAQTLQISGKAIRECADFDPEDAKHARVKIIGDVHLNDRGGYVKPTNVTLI